MADADVTTLLPTGSTWKYLVTASAPAASWKDTGFDDSTWPSGPAQLGYGDGGEATLLSYGPDPNNKYRTTYFRKTFTVTDSADIFGLTVRLLRDDGAVVYLNGNEIVRSNMPAGTVSYSTAASSAVAGADESTFYSFPAPSTGLLEGSNTLAVELHQATATSSDISFDLELLGSGLEVTRGPYLQVGTPTGLSVRWRTNGASDSAVHYGLAEDSLTSTVSNSALVTDHELSIGGLQPYTRYYYVVGTTTETLVGNSETYFYTAAAAGSRHKTRMWVLGDSGTANANAAAVRNAFNAFTGSRHTDLWLMLGDNAYNAGTDAEYEAAVFDMYEPLLKKSVLWPTIGNHDASNTPVYYDIFTMPTAAQAGGVPSGSEAYYSFNYGRIHFICLDSHNSNRTTTGSQYIWLQDDLNANDMDWTIAFWHHPPYTKGSHDSDNVTDSGGRMKDMRENFLPLLENHGVDLVLTGHSHSYERSFLLNGHYDISTSFTIDHKLNGGDGRMDGDGSYGKGTISPDADDGAVYVVAGSSGQISGGPLNHPAMYISLNALGSMVIDVDANRLDARFVMSNAGTGDYFTIVKDAATTPAVASVVRLDENPTSASTVRFKVTFNQTVTGVSMADFDVVTSGDLSGVILSSLTGSGSEYEVGINTGTGDGTIRLDVVDDDTIFSDTGAQLGGDDAAPFQTGEVYTIARAVPVTVTGLRIE